MTGYRPNYALLDRLGIEYSADEACIPVYDEQHLETNRKGIYVAGVVCAGKKTSTLLLKIQEYTRNRLLHILCSQWNKKLH